MAGALLAEHGVDLVVTTSGTHVIEGLPMSWRTADAIRALGLEVPNHRSRQATDSEIETADLVIAAAHEHARGCAECTRMPPRDRHAETPRRRPRVAGWEHVCRPCRRARPRERGARAVGGRDRSAGGEADVFVATAHEIAEQVHLLAPRLVP